MMAHVSISTKHLFASATITSAIDAIYTCDSPIYCDGPLLRTVQLARLFKDSKTFVDMPTVKPVDQVLKAFDDIGGENASRSDIGLFVSENFAPAGTEVTRYPLPAYDDPPWFEQVDDIHYRGWLEVLHRTWGNLTFQYDASQICDGCGSTVLPSKHPFVLPGGRFREFYYWDSYFTIRGLLLSDLDELAREFIQNILDFVDTYGFMPNGARMYYLNRSHPPFLTEMVKEYYAKTRDEEFLKQALPVLDKEYTFWKTNTSVQLTDSTTGSHYQLNRYIVDNDAPRPESYAEDYDTAYLDTDMESTLATWYRDGSAKQKYYKRQAARRLEAMDRFLWDEDAASFFDYNLTSQSRSHEFTPASLFPFWMGAVPNRVKNNQETLQHVLDMTRQAMQKDPGVLTTSEYNTHLQWDWPNGWPPLQFAAVKAMMNIGAMLKDIDQKQRTHILARTLAERNTASGYCSWYRTGGSLPNGLLTKLPNEQDNGHMFEKYDVRTMGEAGFGGEYVVQVGFGMTNGVLMWMLDAFPDLEAPDCNAVFTYPTQS
ncbi:glycoside hydrolase [Lichtheimia hyalospora FSU 10163]|nr:glycoside hydrolase [Lichtheimia hyalospora FSU 10163]